MDLDDADIQALKLIAEGDYSASWIARDILAYADEPIESERPNPNTENEERSVFAH
jgi:hypothetical protein